MTITDIELSDNIKIFKTGAIQNLNEISWTPGKILYMQYRNGSAGKIYVLGAMGVGVGTGSQNYCIISDSEANETVIADEVSKAYNTTINMNGEQYEVMNNTEDTIISDPFEIRNFN